jgi:hypothetical protein
MRLIFFLTIITDETKNNLHFLWRWWWFKNCMHCVLALYIKWLLVLKHVQNPDDILENIYQLSTKITQYVVKGNHKTYIHWRIYNLILHSLCHFTWRQIISERLSETCITEADHVNHVCHHVSPHCEIHDHNNQHGHCICHFPHIKFY